MDFSIPFNYFPLFQGPFINSAWHLMSSLILTYISIYPVSSSATSQHQSCTQTIQNFSHPSLPVCFIYIHICTCYFRIHFQNAYNALLPTPACILLSILPISVHIFVRLFLPYPKCWSFCHYSLYMYITGSIYHTVAYTYYITYYAEHIIVMSTLG